MQTSEVWWFKGSPGNWFMRYYLIKKTHQLKSGWWTGSRCSPWVQSPGSQKKEYLHTNPLVMFSHISNTLLLIVATTLFNLSVELLTLMQMKRLMYLVNVGKSSFLWVILSNWNHFTVEKLLCVSNVENPPVLQFTWKSAKEFTLDRNPTCVNNVTQPSLL
jgi:hypothetical protein